MNFEDCNNRNGTLKLRSHSTTISESMPIEAVEDILTAFGINRRGLNTRQRCLSQMELNLSVIDTMLTTTTLVILKAMKLSVSAYARRRK